MPQKYIHFYIQIHIDHMKNCCMYLRSISAHVHVAHDLIGSDFLKLYEYVFPCTFWSDSTVCLSVLCFVIKRTLRVILMFIAFCGI